VFYYFASEDGDDHFNNLVKVEAACKPFSPIISTEVSYLSIALSSISSLLVFFFKSTSSNIKPAATWCCQWVPQMRIPKRVFPLPQGSALMTMFSMTSEFAKAFPIILLAVLGHLNPFFAAVRTSGVLWAAMNRGGFFKDSWW